MPTTVNPVVTRIVNVGGGLTKAQADQLYYSNTNPSGFASGIDNSALLPRNETGQFLHTGQAAITYYPLKSNPSGYLTGVQTGHLAEKSYVDAVSGLIGGITAGVSSVNTATGAVLLTGKGNVSISVQGQSITISGNTGDYATFLFRSETGQFASDVDVAAVQTQVTTLSSWTGITTGLFYPLGTNPSGYLRSVDTGNLADKGYVTGASGYLRDLISASSAGVGSINSTSGALTLAGAGNVAITTNGQTITISGNTGAYNTLVFKSETGQFIGHNETGEFAGISYVDNNFSKVRVTGNSTTVLVPDFSGAGLVSVRLTGSQIIISGDSSSLVAKSETGQFASDADVTVVQTQVTTINNWTGTTTGIFVQRTETGQYIGHNETGDFAGFSYVNNTFSKVTVSGSSTLLNPDFTGAGAVSVRVVGNQVLISGSGSAGGGEANTASNIGSGVGTFSGKNGVDLRFYSLTGVGGTTVVLTGSEIRISGDNNFVTPAQTGNLADKGYVTGASGYLRTLINASNAGVSSINSASGALTLAGAGNVAITTNGQTITISGDTGAYSTFVFKSESGQFAGKSYVDNNFSLVKVTGLSMLTPDFSGAGNVSIKTTGSQIIVSGDISSLVLKSETGQFSSDVDVAGVQTQVTTINNWTGTTTGIFVQRTETGQYIGHNETGEFAGKSYVDNNFSLVRVTGFNMLTPNFTGTGIISVKTSGSLVIVSGDISSLVLKSETGQFASDTDVAGVQTQVTTINSWTGTTTGIFYPLNSNPSGYLTSAPSNPAGVTGIRAIGSSPLTGLIDLVGAGTVRVLQSGNGFQISGGAATSGDSLPFVFGNINISSGVEESQFIQFKQNFSASPIVLGNLLNNSGDPIVGYHTSGVSTSGFFLSLSDSVLTQNYFFHYLATTGSGFYNIGSTSSSIVIISGSGGTGGGANIVGGTSGQFLTKASDSDNDFEWTSVLLGGSYSGAAVSPFTPNANFGNTVDIGVVTGSLTMNVPTGKIRDTQTIYLRFQIGQSGQFITWNSGYAFGSDIVTGMIPTGSGSKFEVGCRYHSRDLKWRVVGLVRGF